MQETHGRTEVPYVFSIHPADFIYHNIRPYTFIYSNPPALGENLAAAETLFPATSFCTLWWRQPGVVQLWKSFISFHCVGSVKSLWNLVRNVLFSKSEHVLVVLSFDKSRLKCVDFLPNLRVPGVKVSLLIFINSIIFTCWTQFFAFASIIIAFGLTGMVHLCTDKLYLRNLSENAWYSYCAITKRHIRYFCC